VWKVVERRLGRAGGAKQREKRQREWDRKYGEDRWAVGYVIEGAFVLQEQALADVYYRSYEAHFAAHPEDLEELVRTAKVLRNPHAEATTGVDLQVPRSPTTCAAMASRSPAPRSSTSGRGRAAPRTRSASGSARSRSRAASGPT
jgi:hypothetical protein